MTRSVLSACLCVAVLLVVTTGAEAKPPDLPLDQHYYVAPQIPNDLAEWKTAGAPPPAGQTLAMFINPSQMPVHLPWLFQLSPTPRRHFSTYLMLGVHPLLLLMPTENLLDTPADHPCQPEPMPITFPLEVFAPKDGGIPVTTLVRCYQPDDPPNFEEWTCPWLRQQETKSRIHATTGRVPRDVIGNLQRLLEADQAVEIGPEFSCDGCCLEVWDDLNEKASCSYPQLHAEYRAANAVLYLFAKMYQSDSSLEDQVVCHTGFIADNSLEDPRIEFLQEHPLHASLFMYQEIWMSFPGHWGFGGPTALDDNERKIEQSLLRPVTMNFTNMPLLEVMENLRNWIGINIYIDVRACEDEGIKPEKLDVNMQFDHVSLKSALDLMLRPHGLACVVKDDMLQITTQSQACGKQQLKLYAVKELLKGQRQANDAPLEENLIRLITSTISPNSWRERGGQGVIEYFPIKKTLVVNQTPEIQEEVAGLLATLRRAKDKWAEDQHQALAQCAFSVQVDGLLKACRILHDSGNHRQADDLARAAFVLDAEKVLDDPLVSQIYLRVRQQSRYQVSPAEKSAQPCGVCPAGYGWKESEQATPILDVLKPTLPLVDHKIVPALEVVEEESEAAPSIGGRDTLVPQTRAGQECPAHRSEKSECPAHRSEKHALLPLAEAKPFRASPNAVSFELSAAKDGSSLNEDGSGFSLFGDLLEMCLPDPPRHGCFEVGLDQTGLQVFGEWRLNGSVFHMVYRHGGMAIWTTPGATENDK